ncbi:MAG: glycosyltransferase [Peptostreptococcus sp.]
MNENNIKGLFTANHEKIMAIQSLLGKNDTLNMYSVQFYDVGVGKILKKIKGKKLFVNNGESFERDGVVYRKEYLKVNIRNRMIEKQDDDYEKYKEFIEKHEKEILNCDAVVAMWGYPHGRLAYHIGKKYNKPYFVQYYGSDIHTNPYRNENVKKKVVEILNNASNNFFVSEKLKESANGLGWNKNNWSLTKNGVNFKKFYQIDKKEKEELKNELSIKDEIVIGYVGSLTEVKRSDALIDIYSKVDEKRKCKYIFVGDGDMRSQVEEDAKKNNLDTIFTGNVDISDVNRYMNLMDIMVLPSRREGFGSVIVEANSLGVLAIGSDAGGIPEVIGNDRYIVKEGENFEQRYADTIIESIDSGWSKEELIDRTRKEYDWKNIARDDLDIIRRVIKHEE